MGYVWPSSKVEQANEMTLIFSMVVRSCACTCAYRLQCMSRMNERQVLSKVVRKYFQKVSEPAVHDVPPKIEYSEMVAFGEVPSVKINSVRGCACSRAPLQPAAVLRPAGERRWPRLAAGNTHVKFRSNNVKCL